MPNSSIDMRELQTVRLEGGRDVAVDVADGLGQLRPAFTSCSLRLDPTVRPFLSLIHHKHLIRIRTDHSVFKRKHPTSP